jgi:hypothetical protein
MPNGTTIANGSIVHQIARRPDRRAQAARQNSRQDPQASPMHLPSALQTVGPW